MVEVEPSGLAWAKSSASGAIVDKQACVEVARAVDRVLVRTSRDRRGGRLEFSGRSWTAFIEDVGKV
ncbi:DUF397 domain-containing protein [Actinosynnema sp. NPDC059797]